MKKIILHILIVLFLGCKNQTSKINNITADLKNDSISIVKEDSISKIIIEEEDCIFDQATQTDDFLKGIKELEGYIWNQEARTATVQFSETETLEIYRGGCNHFVKSITFKLISQNISYPEDKEEVFKKILWATKLIEEFDYKLIEKDILNENFEIYNGHNNTSLGLLSEKNNSLYIWISDHSEYSEFSIMETIN